MERVCVRVESGWSIAMDSVNFVLPLPLAGTLARRWNVIELGVDFVKRSPVLQLRWTSKHRPAIF